MPETEERTQFKCPVCGGTELRAYFEVVMSVNLFKVESKHGPFVDYEPAWIPDMRDLELSDDHYRCPKCNAEYDTDSLEPYKE